jgi:aflatoxin B1 aldehyde reductase
MHCPENRTSLEDTFAGINELYRQGAFQRLGLSNYSTQEVEDVVRISKERGWVQPTVYQGMYSAITRRCEEDLLPVLRKYGICFYAWSPLAGGFLTKTPESALTKGRLSDTGPIGQLSNKVYNKPAYLDALKVWGNVAAAEGISRAELGLRWITYASELKAELGDGIVVGSKTHEQMKQTVVWVRNGPLSAEALKRIQVMWDSVRKDAEIDPFH